MTTGATAVAEDVEHLQPGVVSSMAGYGGQVFPVVQGGDDWEVLTSVDIKNAGSKEGKLSQINYSTAKQFREVAMDSDAKDHMLLPKKEVMKIPGKDETNCQRLIDVKLSDVR